MRMDNETPLKVIFDYNDVFFSFFYEDVSGCFHQAREYALNYVYSGEMILDNGKSKIHVKAGECVFIPRDHQITMYKKPYQGKRYCGIFLNFKRPFLRQMYKRFYRTNGLDTTPKMERKVIKLPPTAEISSLFESMTPYFNPEVKPQADLMELKLQEGLLALLHIDPRFGPTIFDFNEPWKIDIIDFMNQNYMCELSLSDIAHFTGRSLATFKRDFKKVSELSPEKWLIRKRLNEAYRELKEGGKKVTEVYALVGFKNPSHFSTTFKKQFGVSPTALHSGS